jgi:Tol biopolymer transport system component
MEVVWYDFHGTRLSTPTFQVNPGRYDSTPSLSPDAKRVAVDRVDNNRSAIWIYDAARATGERFTFDNGFDVSPVWSPDGKSILFASQRTTHFDIYRKRVDDGGVEQLLLRNGSDNYPRSISPDGTFLLFERHSDQDPRISVWVLPLIGDAKPFPLLESPVEELPGEFSPDGRWVAYASTETGRSEIFIARFRPDGPTSAARQIMTADNAFFPHCRKDGKELLFYAPQHITALPISLKDGTAAGAAREITVPDGSVYAYDIAPDGNRFLAKTRSRDTATRPITVVLNWLLTLPRNRDSRESPE